MDFMNEKYNIMDVVDAISNFENKVGESFFDFTLTQVDGKNIRACREKEINEGIIVTDNYDLYIVKYEIGIIIKREYVMNMFANLDDFISEHMKNEDNEQ